MIVADRANGNRNGLGEQDLGAAGNGRPTAHEIASRLLAFSRIRRRVFEPFSMPVDDIAWQLLLVLFVAHEHGRRLSIYRLCGDIPAPKGVSVRWLRAMRASGMVDYDSDGPGLSAPVHLTPAAEASLRELMDA